MALTSDSQRSVDPQVNNIAELLKTARNELIVARTVAGKHSMAFVEASFRLAHLQLSVGHTRRAIQGLRRIVATATKVGGPKHLLVAKSLRMMADAYLGGLDDSSASLTLLIQAEEIHTRMKNPDPFEYARLLQSLARTRVTRKESRLAMVVATKAVRFTSKLFGKRSLEYAVALESLGSAYVAASQWSQAKTCLVRALEVYSTSSIVDLNSQFAAAVRAELGFVLTRLMDFRQAQNEIETALAVYSLLRPQRDPIVQRLKRWLADARTGSISLKGTLEAADLQEPG